MFRGSSGPDYGAGSGRIDIILPHLNARYRITGMWTQGQNFL
jgi:hypothetical protein